MTFGTRRVEMNNEQSDARSHRVTGKVFRIRPVISGDYPMGWIDRP